MFDDPELSEIDSPAPAIEFCISELNQLSVERPAARMGNIRRTRDVGERSEDESLIAANASDESRRLEREGDLLLADAHKDLRLSTDGSLTRTFPPNASFQVKEDTNVEAFARRLLGPKVSPAQLTAYINVFLDANKIEGGRRAPLKEGDQVVVPGHTADGGITYKADGGKRVTVWQDGSSKTEGSSGEIKFVFKNGKGEDVTISSDPDNFEENYVLRAKNGRVVREDAFGRQTESRIVERDGKEVELPVRVKQGDKTFAISRSRGEDAPNKIVLTEKGKRPVEFKAAENGELISSDGKRGIVPGSYEIYNRTVAKSGEVTQEFSGGLIRKLNADGDRVSTKWTDSAGRTFEERFAPGNDKPASISYTPAGEGASSILLERTKSGRYEAPLMSGGRKIGYHELSFPEGTFLTHDKRRAVTTARFSDGRVVESTDLPHSRAKEVIRRPGGETTTITRDRQGIIKDQEYTDAKGTRIKAEVGRDGKPTSVTIVKDGARTEMKFDRDLGVITGKRTARDGSTETVTLVGNKLIAMNDRNKTTRTEIFDWSSPDRSPVLMPSNFDANGSLVSYDAGKRRITETMAGGRVDTREATGQVEGRTIHGERSYVKPDGEAMVQHSDGTRVRLNSDNTIDRWGPNASDVARKERIPATELAFLKNHRDIDRRDFAEVMRSFSDRPVLRERFFKAMGEIDTAKNLTAEEKSALRKNLLSHVARPAEIFQGSSMCCNVATIQRDMAITMPDQYVKVVLGAVSTGEVQLADGTKQRFDAANLKMNDTTGRDLATRAFQTVAVGLAFPCGTFKNTVDGVGDLRDEDGNRAAFDGITMGQIALASKLLTGKEKAVVHLEKISDLAQLFRENGGRAMTIHVDASRPPFGAGGPVGEMGSHVVTLTRVDQGPPMKFYVQNQWGLAADHSTPETAISADTLWEAMTSNNQDAKVITGNRAGTLDHSKVYTYKEGKASEDREKTETQRGVLERWKR